LVSKLTSVSKDESKVTELLQEAQLADNEWKEYVHFSPNHYTRVLLAVTKEFSLMLLCWNKGQAT